jgi:hypothetical protein
MLVGQSGSDLTPLSINETVAPSPGVALIKIALSSWSWNGEFTENPYQVGPPVWNISQIGLFWPPAWVFVTWPGPSASAGDAMAANTRAARSEFLSMVISDFGVSPSLNRRAKSECDTPGVKETSERQTKAIGDVHDAPAGHNTYNNPSPRRDIHG